MEREKDKKWSKSSINHWGLTGEATSRKTGDFIKSGEPAKRYHSALDRLALDHLALDH